MRYLTWGCKKCGLVVPSTSRAKTRFDTFCPRCGTRNTIYFGPGKKHMFDMRGRPRKVVYRLWKSAREARTEALLANWKVQELRHSTSRFRDRVPGGFRRASSLPDWIQSEKDKEALENLRERLLEEIEDRLDEN